MTLKTSSNKPPRLFGATWRYGLRKCRGPFFLYAGLMLLFLPVLFMLISSAIRLNINSETQVFLSQLSEETRLYITSAYQSVLVLLFTFVLKPLAIIFSAVFGMGLFGFMHRKRSVDTFHALPVRRVPFLAANFLSGLTLLAVPVVVCTLMTALIAGNTGAYWGMMFSFVFTQLFYLLLGMVSCFAFVMFMCVASGTMMDAVVSASILSVAYPVLLLLMQAFLEAVVPGYLFSVDVTVITAFSPFAAYLLQSYWTLEQANSITALQSRVPLSFTIWWIFLTVLLIVASLLLYKRRKSEYAESTYSFSPLKEGMKFLVSASSAFGLGYIAALIYQSDLVFILFALLGALAANTVVEALYSRGLRHFARGTITYGVFVAAFFAFYFISCFGLFGYGYTAPKASDVKYCTVSNMGSMVATEYAYNGAADVNTELAPRDLEYSLVDEDGRRLADLNECYTGEENIEKVIQLQKDLTRMVSGSLNPLSDSFSFGHRIQFTYYLEDGSKVVRQYRLISLYKQNRDDEVKTFEQRLNEVPYMGEDMFGYSDLLNQIKSLEIDYNTYVHAEEVAELEKLTGDAYDKKYEELERKYGDIYESENMFIFWNDLTPQQKTELVALLKELTPIDMENYTPTAMGTIYLESALPQSIADSDWIGLLDDSVDTDELGVRVEINFSGTQNPELVEFIRSVYYAES